MPLTAIGKVYKPALRLRAVEQALRERLERAGLAPAVSVEAQESPRGMAVRFNVAGDVADRHRDAIDSLMAPFALSYRIERVGAS